MGKVILMKVREGGTTEVMLNATFIVALALGCLMLVAVCWVYVTKQTFALGGSVLTVCGVVLVGMSVWRTIEISVSAKNVSAKLEQVATQVTQVQEQTNAVQRRTDDFERFDVRVAQEALIRGGYLPDHFVDGILGPATKEAIRHYQELHGLPQTGELDWATRYALQVPPPHGR